MAIRHVDAGVSVDVNWGGGRVCVEARPDEF